VTAAFLLLSPSCSQKNEEGNDNFNAVAFFAALQLSCSLAKEKEGDGSAITFFATLQLSCSLAKEEEGDGSAITFFFFIFRCQKKKEEGDGSKKAAVAFLQ